MDLQALGFTKEEIEAKVIDAVAERILTDTYFDEDGEESPRSSAFQRRAMEEVKKRIDERIAKLGQTYVLPQLGKMIDEAILQPTNRWGEKQGQPETFIEYMVRRADNYMREPVNNDGNSEADVKAKGGYSSNDRYNTSRLTFLMDKHLKYHIQAAVEGALKDANSAISGGIVEAVKLSLAEVQAKLKVGVTTK